MDTTIRLSYKDINSRAFTDSLRGLVNHKWAALTTAMKLKLIMDTVDAESKKAFTIWDHVMKTQVEFEGEGQEKKPKDMEDYKKKEDEFLATSFTCGKIKKINVTELLGYKFSAVDLTTLAPILMGFEQLTEGEDNAS
jgi:hypothetical protein